MSSEARSETDSEGGDGGHDRRSKRNMRRRKRGGNRRYKPYGIVDDEDFQECEGKTKKKSKRERLGMAPSNTTQFLLDDREARAEAEHESEQKYEAAERRRIRSISCGSGDGAANCSSYLPGSDAGSSSEQESDADREFDQKYLEAKRDRIEKMSKSELEQELLERSRDQETLADKCGKFRTENRQLKELLTANGIPYKKVSAEEEYPTSTTAPDQSCSPQIYSYSPQYESKSPTIAAS